MAVQHDWIIFQLDVRSAFLHGELKGEIYVQQPIGFTKMENKIKYKSWEKLYMDSNKHQDTIQQKETNY